MNQRTKTWTTLLVGTLAAALYACQAEVTPDEGGVATIEDEAALAAKPPPKECTSLPGNLVPPRACIDYCIGDLDKNPTYDCVTDLIDRLGGKGTPTAAQMRACGCTSLGEGNGTGVGRRELYSCGGNPPFMVSVVPGKGTAGIIAADGTKYPSCQFDVTPGGPIYNPSPGNACLKCHDIQNPFIRPKLKKVTTAPSTPTL